MITVDENLPTPDKVKPKWWLEHLRLCEDKERLLRGMELTDSIMNAAQILMQGQFKIASVSRIPPWVHYYPF